MPRLPIIPQTLPQVGGGAGFAAPSGLVQGPSSLPQNELLAEGLGSMGQILAKEAMYRQDMINEIMVREAEAVTTEELTTGMAEFLTLEGADATRAYPTWKENVDAVISRMSRGLGNNMQRMMYAKSVGNLRNNFSARAVEHFAQQQLAEIQGARAATSASSERAYMAAAVQAAKSPSPAGVVGAFDLLDKVHAAWTDETRSPHPATRTSTS